MSIEKIKIYFKIFGTLSPAEFIHAQRIHDVLGDDFPDTSLYNILKRWTQEGILERAKDIKIPPEIKFKLTKKGVTYMNALFKALSPLRVKVQEQEESLNHETENFEESSFEIDDLLLELSEDVAHLIKKEDLKEFQRILKKKLEFLLK